ncbi:MAG: MATE family efflux transporter [Acutalibacteraceae bacterium]|nr:MATE family efflux transporter [Acutalibacteraceae bacterium]
MENVKENKMGHAPLLGLITSMAVPAMFSMIIQALYNIVDSIFVSHYSEAGLTAVSLAYPLQMLIIAVSVGTGVGVNSLVSRKLGEKNFDEANKAASHGLLLGFFNWLVFFILGLTIVKPFINAFTDDPEIARMGIEYLSVVMIYSFGCFIEIVIEKTLQATGNMIFPMLFMLSGAITNIILDPIFIFDSFMGMKCFGMGVKGAAVATVIGQILSMIFALVVLFFKKHDVHISFKNFRFSLNIIKNIYAVGIPAIVMQSITSVMLVLVNSILTKFSNSDIAISVLNIYFKLQSFIFMPCFGLTQGLMPIMGYNYGARNKQRLTTALKYGCCIAGVIMTLGTIIFLTIPDILMGMFNANNEMLEIGCIALRVICLCFIPAAIGIVFSSFYQATGHGLRSMTISMLRQLVILVPAAYLLSNIGLNAVWFAFPIAEAGALILAITFFINLYNKEIKYIDRPDKFNFKN